MVCSQTEFGPLSETRRTASCSLTLGFPPIYGSASETHRRAGGVDPRKNPGNKSGRQTPSLALTPLCHTLEMSNASLKFPYSRIKFHPRSATLANDQLPPGPGSFVPRSDIGFEQVAMLFFERLELNVSPWSCVPAVTESLTSRQLWPTASRTKPNLPQAWVTAGMKPLQVTPGGTVLVRLCAKAFSRISTSG